MRMLVVALVLLGGCGAAPRSEEVPSRLSARALEAEAVALDELAERLRFPVYRGTLRATLTPPPAAGEERLSTLEGRVLGTPDLGRSYQTERTLVLWADHGYLALGWQDDHQLADLAPYFSYGGLERRCDGCVTEHDGRLEVSGAFVGAWGDGSPSSIEITASVAPATSDELDEADLARLVAALDHTAFFGRDDLEGELRREGASVVYTARAHDSRPLEREGCVEMLAYVAERHIDLRDPARHHARIVSIRGLTERCCPIDEATRMPCSPGPRCTVRTIE